MPGQDETEQRKPAAEDGLAEQEFEISRFVEIR
jgi:hypothetical protein